ncbi:MAG TPA: SMP-30/gluconolactonase/LRE family protein, partial [Acidimicrobiia bacterium]|nr:SMP-30/gluconolactonase/LRE family protein [Acidimicrobiia bacterium]
MEAVGDARVSLGEAPLWHGREGRIYWVDINGKTVRRVVGETSELVFEGVMVTALAETVDGELVMVSSDGLFVWREGEVTRLTSLDLPDGVRTNDGKCDPEGRLWFGTMDLEMSNPIGALLRYDGNSVEM